MTRTSVRTRTRLAGTALVLLAGAGLTACGGSSKGTALDTVVATTTTVAAATPSTTTVAATGASAAKPTTTAVATATTAKPAVTTAPTTTRKILSADDVAALEKQLDEIDKTLADAQAELDQN